MAPGWDNLHDLESPEEEAKSMTLAKKCGFNRVAVAKSTIAGAGYGLFLSKGPVKARTLLTSYEGETLTAAQVEEPGRDLSYVYCSGRGKDGRVNYVNARRPDSSFGRFYNDPRDDTLVNAKVVLKGGRLMVMATTDIAEGDEIFLDYGLEYWIDRSTRSTTP
jgi:SET domain-containing protein